MSNEFRQASVGRMSAVVPQERLDEIMLDAGIGSRAVVDGITDRLARRKKLKQLRLRLHPDRAVASKLTADEAHAAFIWLTHVFDGEQNAPQLPLDRPGYVRPTRRYVPAPTASPTQAGARARTSGATRTHEPRSTAPSTPPQRSSARYNKHAAVLIAFVFGWLSLCACGLMPVIVSGMARMATACVTLPEMLAAAACGVATQAGGALLIALARARAYAVVGAATVVAAMHAAVAAALSARSALSAAVCSATAAVARRAAAAGSLVTRPLFRFGARMLGTAGSCGDVSPELEQLAASHSWAAHTGDSHTGHGHSEAVASGGAQSEAPESRTGLSWVGAALGAGADWGPGAWWRTTGAGKGQRVGQPPTSNAPGSEATWPRDWEEAGEARWLPPGWPGRWDRLGCWSHDASALHALREQQLQARATRESFDHGLAIFAWAAGLLSTMAAAPDPSGSLGGWSAGGAQLALACTAPLVAARARALSQMLLVLPLHGAAAVNSATQHALALAGSAAEGAVDAGWAVQAHAKLKLQASREASLDALGALFRVARGTASMAATAAERARVALGSAAHEPSMQPVPSRTLSLVSMGGDWAAPSVASSTAPTLAPSPPAQAVPTAAQEHAPWPLHTASLRQSLWPRAQTSAEAKPRMAALCSVALSPLGAGRLCELRPSLSLLAPVAVQPFGSGAAAHAMGPTVALQTACLLVAGIPIILALLSRAWCRRPLYSRAARGSLGG